MNPKTNSTFMMSWATVCHPFASAKQLLCLMALLWLGWLNLAQAQESQSGLRVPLPNGFAWISTDDLRLQSTGGAVRWMRVWNGQEWKFNPHWESLSQNWKNLTGSQAANTTGNTVTTPAAGFVTITAIASVGGSGCWISTDENWTPTPGAPLSPVRSTPFNRVMSDATAEYPPPVSASVDYASLCPGVTSSQNGVGVQDLNAIRRQNELYVGGNGRYVFNNQSVLEQRGVRGLPTASAADLTAQLASGSITLAPVAMPKGYRWTHKNGNWIDYNLRGQVVAYGDNNDNIVWLARDSGGIVRGVVDANGRVLVTLHYTGELLTEVKDYPIAGNPLDLPPRSVKYQYDGNNRLAQVTDVRGNITRYDYDAANHIVQITDPEGRVEQLAYTDDRIARRTAPDGGVTDYTFQYDNANQQFIGKITGPVTAAGRRVEDYTHNRVGKLVRQIVNGRTDEEVAYDTSRRTEYHTNARGFTTRITRNEFEQIVRTDYPDGTSRQSRYSAQNLQAIEEIDEAGFKTQYQYDAKGNLLKKAEAAGTTDQRITEYEVNDAGQVIKTTRKGRIETNGIVTSDASWQNEYDIYGQIKKTIDPESNVRQYLYDRAGNLVKFVDPLGHATVYELDAAGNLIKVTDALGRVSRYSYDKVGNQVSATDARGKTLQKAYDALNRLLRFTNQVGGTSKLEYNADGKVTSAADADGRTVRLEYDLYRRLTQQSDELGNVTTLGYSVADGTDSGALGSLSMPTSLRFPTYTENHRLDEREREVVRTLIHTNRAGTESLTSSKAFDPRGLVKSETDAAGKSRYYKYDGLGQLIEATDALGGKTLSIYDARGNLIQLTDAKGNVNRFELDRNDRIIKEILPLGQATTYQYNAAGNLSQRVDPNGHKTTYAYDAANHLQEVRQFQRGTTLVRTTNYTWDESDNLTAWTDTDLTRPDGQQTASGSATYDDANHKIGETVNYPNPAGGTYSLGYNYQYSPAGKKTQLVWPDGTVIDYGFTAHGELERVAIPGEGTISFNQFKWKVPVKVTLPGGSSQEKTYDGLLNLEEIKVKTPGQQTVLDLSNGYGKRQELVSRSRTDSQAGQSRTVTSSFGYDDELRLTRAVTDTGGQLDADTETFSLDAVGNRTAHSKVLGEWHYDANNRLTDKGILLDTTTYDYDEAGNLTRKAELTQTRQYVYDTRNRLSEVKDGDGHLIARYGYDPRDRRIWKEQYRDKDGNPLPQAKRSYYLYADEGLIAEATQPISLDLNQIASANTMPAIATEYGPKPDGLFGTGLLFIKTKNSNGDQAIGYYQHDQLGTPIQATDKYGNVVFSAEYNIFGKASITTPPATPNTPIITSGLRFPGQVEDQETGLHYNWHRYYDVADGRYISPDPLGLTDDVTKYRYANGQPLNLIDPTGELFFLIPIAAAEIGIAAGEIGIAAGEALIIVCLRSPPCAARLALGAARLGRLLGNLAGVADECASAPCPPCTPYPVGAIGYQGPEVHQGGIDAGTSHYHLFQVEQIPSNCKCIWKERTKAIGGDHHYIDSPDPSWINLNGSPSRPPNYPH